MPYNPGTLCTWKTFRSDCGRTLLYRIDYVICPIIKLCPNLVLVGLSVQLIRLAVGILQGCLVCPIIKLWKTFISKCGKILFEIEHDFWQFAAGMSSVSLN